MLRRVSNNVLSLPVGVARNEEALVEIAGLIRNLLIRNVEAHL